VRTALLERDEVLRRAREDLSRARTLAVEWEMEVATTHAQFQQDRATLEGVRAWQTQAEERAKEVEQLRTSLADKAASLTSTEEQLHQERDARQQAEAQLQQERTTLAEARATLERERLVREEAQGLLQQECAVLEWAQATLKQWDEEVSRLNGELTQLSVSLADQRQAVEEQEAVILGLQQAAETARVALEAEKKHVEGESSFSSFRLLAWFVWDPFPILLHVFGFFRPGTALGNLATQAQAVQTAYNSSQQELEELRAATLEACQEVEEGEVQVRSSVASRLVALGGHVTRRMRRALHLGVQKALGVVASRYQVDLEAVSTGYVVPVGVDGEVAMNRVDALAAPAADVLAEDFMDFLFPDAPPAGGPEA
jgi:DNA repair exonuclease SbcCD ATPase subunit